MGRRERERVDQCIATSLGVSPSDCKHAGRFERLTGMRSSEVLCYFMFSPSDCKHARRCEKTTGMRSSEVRIF